MNDTAKRLTGYGLVAAISGALIYAGFIYEADPELNQMVSSVELQLGLAGTMASHAGAARGNDGEIIAGVSELLDGAKDELDRIDRAYPNLAAPRFLRGHVAFLEGRYADASTLYREVRTLEGCDAELRDRSVINEAAAMSRVGQRDEAARLLRGHEFGDDRYTEMARSELAAAETKRVDPEPKSASPEESAPEKSPDQGSAELPATPRK